MVEMAVAAPVAAAIEMEKAATSCVAENANLVVTAMTHVQTAATLSALRSAKGVHQGQIATVKAVAGLAEVIALHATLCRATMRR